MEVLSTSKSSGTVKEALKEASKEINKKLSKTPGSISELNVDINVGISGANVQILVTVEDKKERSKKIVWTNQGGSNEEEALTRAKGKINPKIKNIYGEIADFHMEFVSPPLPKRVYVTILVAINGKVSKKTKNLTTRERRSRIKEILSLVGGEANAINISKIAETFDVSRDVIYNDLEKIGTER